MVGGGEQYVASLLFHELAHQKLYVKDDSEFSEAFAMVDRGIRHGALARGSTVRQARSSATTAGYATARSSPSSSARSKRGCARFSRTRAPADELRAAKAHAYDAMRADYAR